MPGSSPTERELVAFYRDRFGVPEELLAPLRVHDRNGELWAASEDPPPGIRSRRPPGLRAARRAPEGLKPTSAFLSLLSPWISRSRCDLEREALRRVLLGGEVAIDASDGYVALAYGGDVVGCGLARSGQLRAVIPTGRRRELLDALDAGDRADATIL